MAVERGCTLIRDRRAIRSPVAVHSPANQTEGVPESHGIVQLRDSAACVAGPGVDIQETSASMSADTQRR